MSLAAAAAPVGAAGARALGPGSVELGGAIAHYGNVAGEYRSLCAGQALVDLGHMEVVAVCGPDRLSWLTTLSTQDVRALAVGESRELLILDPNGRIEHAAFVLDDGACTYLVMDAGRAQPCIEFLFSMRFMLRVEVAPRPDLRVVGAALQAGFVADVAPLAQQAPPPGGEVGSRAGGEGATVAAAETGGAGPADENGALRAALRRILGELTASELVWVDPWPGPDTRSATYFFGEHPARRSAVGCALVAADAALPGIESGRASSAGFLAWEALRVERWRPRLGCEVDARAIPHELDWLRSSVHLDKGCYRGQEAVARIVNLGRPPRRLAFLHLDGSLDVLPGPGAQVFAGAGVQGRPVGAVRSAVLHPELGPVALALLKRSVEPECALTVRAVVATDAGEEIVELAAAPEEIVNLWGKSSVSPAQRPGAELRGR